MNLVAMLRACQVGICRSLIGGLFSPKLQHTNKVIHEYKTISIHSLGIHIFITHMLDVMSLQNN
jgi:hypothetical protein